MGERLRLNKNALREQDERLRALLEFLPTLALRRQQLQAALGRARQALRRGEGRWQALRREAAPWAAVRGAMARDLRPFGEVERREIRMVNVAGLMVPELERVHFAAREPDLLATPLVFDEAVALLRDAARLRAEHDVQRERAERLERELRRTSQRINLYEGVLVPRARRNIRRLRVYLGDQQTAAVCRAKLAKAKVEARPRRPQEGAEDVDR